VLQSNHFHAFDAELPRVYKKLQSTLNRLGVLFQLLTEEAGEALQKVAKVEGYNHSDRKTNVIDTMYRGEQMRDWAIMAYSSGAQDCSAAKRENKRFAATIVPNLAVSCCAYSQNPVFRSMFLLLAASLATKEISTDGFYVYTPSSVNLGTAHFVTVRKPSTSSAGVFQSNFDRARDCSCTCHCKCPDCRPLYHCGCLADCNCLLDSNQCRCHRMPLILIRVGAGPGQQSFLPIRWCNSELPNHINAAIQGLLLDSRPPRNRHETDVLQWPRQLPTGSSLLPGVKYMRQQAHTQIQASATAFLLHKHLLPTARL
jgi:hypothetical protein